MNNAMTARALEMVERCADPDQLRTLIRNAQRMGNHSVVRAAKLKLYAILPDEAPGTLEYDVWQAIHALEDALRDERGKTIRLSRTRQKIGRDGELKAVVDLILKPEAEGFRMLADRDMLDLSFEAVSLKHPERFTSDVLAAARARLDNARAKNEQ